MINTPSISWNNIRSFPDDVRAKIFESKGNEKVEYFANARMDYCAAGLLCWSTAYMAPFGRHPVRHDSISSLPGSIEAALRASENPLLAEIMYVLLSSGASTMQALGPALEKFRLEAIADYASFLEYWDGEPPFRLTWAEEAVGRS